jgi:hypothetical protein
MAFPNLSPARDGGASSSPAALVVTGHVTVLSIETPDGNQIALPRIEHLIQSKKRKSTS